MISVGVPMPSLTAGAKPKSCRVVMSIVDALPYWNMALTRAAFVLSSPKGMFTSAVPRTRPLVVTEPVSSVRFCRVGFFIT